MRIQYILTEEEVSKAKKRLRDLKFAALLSRDAGETEDNREFYLRAKSFEDALITLGVLREERK